MMYYHYGYGPYWGGFGIFDLIWHIVGLAIAVVVIVWLLRTILGAPRRGKWHMRNVWPAHSGLETLNERYAKGEITKEEYEERKSTLLS